MLFLVTEGYRDMLRIGYQNRTRLLDLHIRLPDLVYARVAEIGERMGISIDHVGVLIHRARGKLKKSLARYAPAEQTSATPRRE